MKKADAINYYGSATALAKALSITLQAIGQWGDEVPLLRQYQLERMTDGALRADVPQSTTTARAPQRA
ncbi:Cro/CI family transcriptional regulator [Chromohalobacter salexigens]|uniref:Cro/CI family transcriptional regulator n=1 Tax=Chromohalobacter israelensis TaxID=141390 RepID=UPI0032E88F3F